MRSPRFQAKRERSSGAEERNIAAEAGGQLQQLVARYGVTCQPIRGMECRGGIAGPTAETGSNRNALGEREVDREPVSDRLEHSRGGLHRQILLRGSQVRARHLDCHPTTVPALGPQRVGQAYQTEEGLHAVKAVFLPGEDAQEEVHLGQRREGHRLIGHDGLRRRDLKPPGIRASDHSPSRVMGKKDVTWKAMA